MSRRSSAARRRQRSARSGLLSPGKRNSPWIRRGVLFEMLESRVAPGSVLVEMFSGVAAAQHATWADADDQARDPAAPNDQSTTDSHRDHDPAAAQPDRAGQPPADPPRSAPPPREPSTASHTSGSTDSPAPRRDHGSGTIDVGAGIDLQQQLDPEANVEEDEELVRGKKSARGVRSPWEGFSRPHDSARIPELPSAGSNDSSGASLPHSGGSSSAPSAPRFDPGFPPSAGSPPTSPAATPPASAESSLPPITNSPSAPVPTSSAATPPHDSPPASAVQTGVAPATTAHLGFPDGLDGWTIQQFGGSPEGRGSVSSGSAVLHEGDSFLVTLEQQFAIPEQPLSIEFTYIASFDTSDADSINDAFEVALLDSDGYSLVDTFARQRDAFFNLTEEMAPALGSTTTVETVPAGTRVTLDIADVPEAMPATLVFRLVNNDADQETTVQILSVQVQSAHQPNSLSGYVYLDVNDNGVKDPPEQPLPNVPITLSGAVSQTVLTAADGSYRFDDLPPGTYTITQTQPLAFQDGRETQGAPPLGLVANDRFYDIELPGDIHATGYNFGETGLRAELIGKNLVLASSPSPGQMVSTMMIAGERWFAVQPTVAGTLTTTIPTSVGAPVLELYTAQMLPIALGAGQHTLAAPVQQDTRYVLHVVGQSAEQFPATLSMELPTPVHRTNPANHLDVNADGRVTPLDALILVNALNRLASAGAVTSDDYLDVDGNGRLTPIDVLTVINHLNAPRSAGQSAGEGESPPDSSGAHDSFYASSIGQYVAPAASPLVGRSAASQGEGEGGEPNPSDGDTLLGADDSILFSTSQDFQAGTFFNVNATESADELRLNPPGEIQTFPFIWIANSGEGTASKFDTRTGQELGRYRTGANSVSTLLSPSRTAVTGEGDVWVANRANVNSSYRQGSIVKILNSGFIDRNGNGVMDTSQDLNGDGRISGSELMPWDADGDGQPDDERIAMVINVGRNRTAPYSLRSDAGVPRAVALDADDNVWVGLYNLRQYEVYNGETGALLAIVPTTYRPYGATVDPQGQLWGAAVSDNRLERIDTKTRTYVGSVNVGQTYGITVDESGIVWSALWTDRKLLRYDPATGSTTYYDTPSGESELRGVSVDRDGNVWVASTNTDRLIKFVFAPDGRTLLSRQVVQVGDGPSASVMDADGFIWTTTLFDNLAWKIDPTTNSVVSGWPVPTGAFPYNYSDMTGHVRLTATERTGTWTEIIDSQRPRQTWGTVALDSLTPPGSGVELRVRAGDTRSLLEASPWSTVQSGQSLHAFRGRYLEVQLRFTSTEPTSTPSVQSLTVAAASPPAIQVGHPHHRSELPTGETILLSGTARATANVGPTDTVIPNRIVAVLVNGVAVDALDSAGNFFFQTTIVPGDNVFEVLAIDAFGQRATETVTVFGSEPDERIIEDRLFDVSPSFRAAYARTSFDDRNSLLYAQLAVENVGQYPADIPLLVGIRNISDPSVSVIGAAGRTRAGMPYYNFTELVPGSSLDASQITGFVDATFHNPDRVPFTYELVFLAKLNEAPAFTTVPVLHAYLGRSYAYDADAVDPDADPLTYSLVTAPRSMAIAAETGQISWMPTEADRGTQQVVLRVADGRGGAAEQRFTIEVTDLPPNRPPIITSLPVTEATVSSVSSVEEQLVTLAEWQTVHHDQTYGGNYAQTVTSPVWTLDAAGTTATQQVNADASILLSDFQLTSDRIRGTWQVDDTGSLGGNTVDDDFMGFVFGYQDSGHFYLFDWKRADQAYEDSLGRAGMSVKVVSATSPLTIADLWNTDGNGDRVRTIFHNSIPWQNHTDYDFELIFQPGKFTITVSRAGSILESVTLHDATYTSGQFGFYNYSQGQVSYRGFTRQPVAEITYRYDVEATDPDFDPVNFELAQSPSGMQIDPASGLITWAPTAHQLGPHPVTVQASDGRGGVDQQSFVVQVKPQPGNHPPVIVSKPITTQLAGSAYAYDVDAIDPDDNPLEYVLLEGPVGMTVNAATGLIDWSEFSTILGSHPVTLQVSDGRGGFDTQAFTVSISDAGTGEISGKKYNDINADGRYVADAETVVIEQDTTWRVTDRQPTPGWSSTVDFDDSDAAGWKNAAVIAGVQRLLGNRSIWFNSNLQGPPRVAFFRKEFLLPARPTAALMDIGIDDDAKVYVNGHLALDDHNGHHDTFRGINILPFLQTGRNLIAVRAEDSWGGNRSLEVRLTVETQSPEDPGLPAWIIYLDDNHNARRDAGERFAVTDELGNYAFTGLPPGEYVIAEEMKPGWVQTAPDSRTHVVTLAAGEVVATKDFGNSSVSGGNLPPEFTSDPPGTAAVDQLVRYSSEAIDGNNDPLTFDLPLAPDGMTVHPDLGIVVWQPTIEQVGPNQVVLRVSDGRGGVDIQSFVLDVQPPNTAPVITTDALPAMIQAGLPLRAVITAQDSERDAIAFSLSSTASGAQLPGIGPETGMLTWTPQVSQLGSHELTVTATDARGAASSRTYAVQVVEVLPNDPPVITSAPRTTTRIDVPYAYRVEAQDPNGDPLSFALNPNAPGGMTIDSGGILRWEPSGADLGSHPIVITVSDGRGGQAIQEFELQVVPDAVNSPPRITSNPPLHALLNSTYRYPAAAYDAEGDAVIWSLDLAPPGMSVDALSGQVCWTPRPEHAGSAHPVVLRATDAFGASARQSFTIAVRHVNRPPMILSAAQTEAFAGQAYVYAAQARDPDGDRVEFSLLENLHPGGMTIDAQTGLIEWTPTAAQTGPHAVSVMARDTYGGIDIQGFSIQVTDRNRNFAPRITSTPRYSVSAGHEYRYHAAASDPEGDVVTFSLEGVNLPAGLDITPVGILAWTPGSSDVGTYTLSIVATDTAQNRARLTYTLQVRENQPPNITSTPRTTGSAGVRYSYDLRATDPEGDPLGYALAEAPAGMTIDDQGRLRWDPDIGLMNQSFAVRVVVSDPFGGTAEQPFTIGLEPDTTPPRINLDAPANRVTFAGNQSNPPGSQVALGGTVAFEVRASDNIGIADVALFVDGTRVPLIGQSELRVAEIAFNTRGIVEVVASATDLAGNSSSTDPWRVQVFDPNDQQHPTVTINSLIPQVYDETTGSLKDGAPIVGDDLHKTPTLTYLTDVEVTISDDNPAEWRIEYIPTRLMDSSNIGASDPDYVLLASGSGELDHQRFRIDTTLMANDAYILRVISFDVNGQGWAEAIAFGVSGAAKLGNFTFTVADLAVPLAGIPITISRTYDTLRANVESDFGFGWAMAISTADIAETVPRNGEFVPGQTRVYVTTPDGRRVGFTYNEEPLPLFCFGANRCTYQGLLGDTLNRPYFTPDPGVYDKLEIDIKEVSRGGFSNIAVQIAEALSGGPYVNPDVYTLITQDGLKYRYDQYVGLQEITDRNGNVVRFTNTAITHSSGLKIDLVRDARGRIKQIIDTAGDSIYYTYDAAKNLVRFTNQIGDTTTYAYRDTPAHFLDEIHDALGVRIFKAEFDESGRLTGSTDALGNVVQQDFDAAAFTGTITDAKGNVTALGYDERGNIVRRTDPLGHTSQYTYDNSNNLLTETNPLGHVTSLTYDSRGNLATKTDPLGNTLTFGYNINGQVTTITDPLGHPYTYVYDTQGNRVQETDPLGHSTRTSYDSAGRIIAEQDQLGYTTTFEYDTAGNRIAEVDPLGNRIAYAYDVYGNRTGTARTRTDADGVQHEITTSARFDPLGRPTQTTDVLGHTTTYGYGANGKLTSIIDALDRKTVYEYDANGNLRKTAYWDGTFEEKTYDANGNVLEERDRFGRITAYEFDALDREVKRVQPDGHTFETEYDEAGREVGAVVNGRRWEYDHDPGHSFMIQDLSHQKPRITRSAAPDGTAAAIAYDANGNVIAMSGPDGAVRIITYDALNRPALIDAAGKTSIVFALDAKGQLAGATQPTGIDYDYIYDPLGRLTKVIDPLGHETSYTYDELGNKLSQTDANGHTTTWQYDDASRMIKRTLPLGMFETLSYEFDGRLASKTDFNGKTTTYTYNVLGQLMTEAYADGSSVSFTYTPGGDRSTIVDTRGTTTYEYDGFGRVTEVTNPDGSFLQYTYNSQAQRESITSLSGTTSYRYDQNGSLETVTGPDGGVTLYEYNAADRSVTTRLPNGTRTEATSDPLQRVTLIRHLDALDAVFAEFAIHYEDEASNVRSVTELDRTLKYTYDLLHRLVEEEIVDAIHGDETISYTYDAVSNRLSKTDSSRTIDYQYDANNRLVADSEWTYAYDDNGNLRSKFNATGSWTYSYDFKDRLIKVVRPDGGTVEYSYDVDGVLISRTVDTQKTVFVVDKEVQYHRVIEELDAGDNVTAYYTYGNSNRSRKSGLGARRFRSR